MTNRSTACKERAGFDAEPGSNRFIRTLFRVTKMGQNGT
jgi:hypothetical protein